MSISDLTDPVFIAKVIDFVIFVVAITIVFNRFIKPQLVAQQEAQNKAVEDAAAYRDQCTASVESAKAALAQAESDSARMQSTARAQADRMLADDIAAAEEHAKRVITHAEGELERERYRVRRELLEETVNRAHAEARDVVRRDLTPAQQQALVERLVADLERSHV